MDFTPNDEHLAMGEAVRELITRHAKTVDTTGKHSVAPPQLDKELWSALAEIGVLALAWPEDLGGMEAGATALEAVAEQLGATGTQVPLAESVLAGSVLAASQCRAKGEIIGGLCEGSALPVPALAEPMRAWSAQPVDVTATRAGEGWTLTGTKAPVRYAADATHLVVSAATDEGTGLFLVAEPGATKDSVVFEGREAELLFLGDEADQVLRRALGLARTVLLGEAIGAMEEGLRMTVDYLKTRRQFGVPLASFQTLTHRAADMFAELELARSSVLYAAMTIEADPDATDAVLRAAVSVSSAAKLIGAEQIQMHGGIGVTTEHRIGHLTARLVDIDRTWGGHSSRVADLATRLTDHGQVDVLG